MTIFLYTLELRAQCYYVGTTHNPKRRLKEHREGKGAEWTRLHVPLGISTRHPLKVLTCSEQEARLKEDAHVKKLMLQHGIDSVRGGSYCNLNLSREDVSALCKELFHANNGCLRCGRRNHWASDCYARIDVVGNTIGGAPARKRKRPFGCTRCGRLNHTEEDCYAKKDVDGDLISDSEEGMSESEDSSSASDEEVSASP